jgi:hypothetical protein
MDTVLTIVTIIAIVLGPILAVQVQKFIERLRQTREEKIRIFVTLLTTKGHLVPEHVRALNSIHFFFRDERKQDKAVVQAWDVYRNHLNNGVARPQPQADGKIAPEIQTKFSSDLERWSEKGDDLLCELLKKMAESLGYDFPDLLLKQGAYTPQGYADVEQYQYIILKGMTEVLAGIRPFPMRITDLPTNEEGQKALLAVLKGERSLPVHIEGLPTNLGEVKATGKRVNP